jgi:signal transduction histidine kinase
LLAACLILAGYAMGVVTACGRRAAGDLAYILRLREELRHSQNHIMDNAAFLSLGAYVDSAAEDIKGALDPLTTTAQALASDPELSETARRLALDLRAQIEALGSRLRHLVRYALTRPARAPFGINTLLREAIHLCRHRAEEKQIVFEEHYAVVPPVFGPASRMHQAILNVLVNAIEAMPHGGGTIVVETAHEGDQVVARVRDSGIGIRPEHLPRIFDPFFTTKPEKSCVGLGLWATHRMVDMVGGTIQVASTPLQGTEMTLRFPQAAPVRAGREGTAHPPEILRNTADERDRRIA